MAVSTTIIQAPITSLISGMTGAILQYIKSAFDSNFFSQTYIGSAELAFDQNRYTTLKDKFTRKFPFLAINPSFSLESMSDFDVACLDPITNPAASLIGLNNLNKIKVIKRNGLNIYGFTRRMSVNYDCIMKFDNAMQAINATNRIKNFILFGKPLILKNKLSVQIPREFIELLFDKTVYDLTDAKVISLLSNGSIVVNRNMGTSELNYFFSYAANILLKCDGLSYEKNMLKQAQGNSTVKFTVTTEAWFLSLFSAEFDSHTYNMDLFNAIQKAYTGQGSVFSINLAFQGMPVENVRNNKVLIWNMTYRSDANVVVDLFPLSEDIEPTLLAKLKAAAPTDYEICIVDEFRKILDPSTYTINADFNVELSSPYFNTEYIVFIYAGLNITGEREIIQKRIVY